VRLVLERHHELPRANADRRLGMGRGNAKCKIQNANQKSARDNAAKIAAAFIPQPEEHAV
jgi:hypothetical protein